ncbi:hypothetical protein BMH32_14000 [Leucobacter sp. OLJS4]|uniref:GNAT family N-acetyltransferase n=1 Tax=unclassified Leucobacter TaxID=2621730 RepID=UPI000C5B23E0|nr:MULTISPECIES: GNAT family N-acetyltransferase [unclassified Leucobacter]PII87844.1 hypothetical protein BMH26_08130 [Leucobacter sp. OLTLW20]PII93901.1 hypothetical protein BMH27_02405 [Leucobacter sp. OLAS13]PII98568.1 hypothetical protein BMH29_08330 [Leucobacter sp. OLDS2]PIJ05521.1 hypothetical protein BMH31_00135 [Leucobacter sp. OLIS6]PIJ06683.1 hypothetical protein BMH32_14000 [Leucobacter sp. OLJS4]
MTAGSETRIRAALPTEYAEIDRLIDAAYAHDYGEDEHDDDPMHRSAVRAESFDVWVATDEHGDLLGSVTTRRAGGPPLHEDVAADELDLRLLGVAVRARRRGIAAALMRHVLAEARTQGFSAVVLKTAPNMRGAHRLYETLGFERAPERDGLWIDGVRVLELFTYAQRLDDLD